jgi:hypothetical protein
VGIVVRPFSFNRQLIFYTDKLIIMVISITINNISIAFDPHVCRPLRINIIVVTGLLPTICLLHISGYKCDFKKLCMENSKHSHIVFDLALGCRE